MYVNADGQNKMRVSPEIVFSHLLMPDHVLRPGEALPAGVAQIRFVRVHPRSLPVDVALDRGLDLAVRAGEVHQLVAPGIFFTLNFENITTT